MRCALRFGVDCEAASLLAEEMGVGASLAQQFLVIAGFDDTSVIQNHDLIGSDRAAQAMRYQENGATFHQAFECLLPEKQDK